MKLAPLLLFVLIPFSSALAQERGDSLRLDGWLEGLEKPLAGQELLEQKLTINTANRDLAELVPMPDLKLPSVDPQKVMPNWHWEGLNMPNFTTDQSPLFKGDYSVGGTILGNRRQYLYGSGYQHHIPGLCVQAQAAVGYAYIINPRLSVKVYGGLTKQTGLMPVVSTYGTVGAMVNYSITDNLSVHGFANVNSNMYDMSRWTVNYGAYLDWQISDHWGADLGVQHTQDYMGYGRTQPIVRPYYKMNNGAKLGIDFGGLIQNALQKNSGIGAGPGMIPSPKQFITMPRVAPRN